MCIGDELPELQVHVIVQLDPIQLHITSLHDWKQLLSLPVPVNRLVHPHPSRHLHDSLRPLLQTFHKAATGKSVKLLNFRISDGTNNHLSFVPTLAVLNSAEELRVV